MLTPLEELTSISQILHLIHHRNHNQHRVAKWYAQFSQLRRQVRKLVEEVEGLETAVKYDVGAKGKGKVKGGEGKYVIKAREKVGLRVRFLEDVLVERCYSAFTNLIADSQYSVLGMVLLGNLARIKTVIRPLRWGDQEDDTEGSKKQSLDEQSKIPEKTADEADDLGEVITREEVEVISQESNKRRRWREAQEKRELKLAEGDPFKEGKTGQKEEGDSKIQKRASKPEATPSKPPKKKRKKGDAFDDLFDGLI